MCSSLLYLVLALGLSFAPIVSAWGAVGHEIVATIAQMYLKPSTLSNICSILEYSSSNPNEQECHLAPVATWADRYKNKMRWSAALHYVGAIGDHPPQTCTFPGDQGWAGHSQVNVLGGIRNVTNILRGSNGRESPRANEALKFLVHFLGDLHMPLHLTGRDRGGNNVTVLFDSRHTNLHSLWDSRLIAKAVRTVPRNYSHPLPYPEIEFALRGTIYDSFIRKIMWEGILNLWKDDIEGWKSCPPVEDPSSHNIWPQIKLGLQKFFGRPDIAQKTDDDIVCPYHWSQPIHQLNCDLVWPKELDEPPFNHPSHGRPLYLELDTPKYSGRIAKDLVVEKLLAQAGIRLAGTLNRLFADDGGLNDLGVLWKL